MTITSDGHHGEFRKNSSARNQRHNEMNDVNQRALSRASVPSTLEQVGLCAIAKKEFTAQPTTFQKWEVHVLGCNLHGYF